MRAMSHVLDYRTPANELRLRRIARAIRAREGVFWLKLAAMLAVGVVASFLGPIVVASIARKFLGALDVPISGAAAFQLSLLTVMPLLYWLELRTRGSFLSEELQAQGTTGEHLFSTSSFGEWEFRRTAVAYAVWIEVFLYGPRMTIDAVRQSSARIRLRNPAVHRAAEIVMLLATVDGGVSLGMLRGVDDPDDLRRTLTYLRLHDWIDIGDHGRRAWLLSTARRRLPK
jgi:hypothetical protein